jgi:hypothetical protein
MATQTQTLVQTTIRHGRRIEADVPDLPEGLRVHLTIVPDSLLLAELFAKMDELKTYQERWNGYNVAAADIAAIERGKDWIVRLYEVIPAEQWAQPHVGLDEEGSPAFGWYQKERSLDVYVQEEGAHWVRTEGKGHPIDDGEVNTPEQMAEMWQWLRGDFDEQQR